MKNKSSKLESHIAKTMQVNFELLSKIKRVEAPTYLFNLIHEKITNQTHDYISRKWVYAIAASVLLLLSLNLFTLAHNSKSSQTASLAKNMNLINIDNFYNEE